MGKRAPANPDKFEEASTWFRARTPVTRPEWDVMSKAARRQAFTVAGTQQLKVVQTVFDEISKSIDKGTPLSEFKKALKLKLGAEFTKQNSTTLTTAFINANQTAYNTGRYYQLNDPAVTDALPYQMWDSVMDGRTSEICIVCNGTIRRHDDPWWLTHWPPMHHRCRSTVRAISAAMAQRMGGITKTLPRPAIHDDWGLAPPLRVGEVWTPDPAKYDGAAFGQYQRKQARMAANDNARKVDEAAKQKAREDAVLEEQNRLRRNPTAPGWMSEKQLEVTADKRPASMGVNAARQLTIDDAGVERKAIWKVADAANTGDAKGEVAMYRLDQLMGGNTVVPPTVARRFDGQAGSLQAFVPDAVPTFKLRNEAGWTAADEAKLITNPEVRRMFLLDVIAANEDRHEENTLWTRVGGELRPHAIDNGLSFTKVEVRGFRFALEQAEFKLAMTELDVASIELLRGLSLSEVAETLHAGGLSSERVKDTLGRVRSLQNNHQQLMRHADKENPEKTVADWLKQSASDRAKAGQLSADDLREINKLSKKP